MGILTKCDRFTRSRELQAAGIYPYFSVIESSQGTEVLVGGRKMLMLGSNSYLGLSNHPAVIEAAVAAVKKYGTSASGSRFLNGTLDIHVELEEKLARFTGRDRALVFSTGLQANLGTIPALVSKDDVVIVDKADHASIIDGCQLAPGTMKRYNHNDMADLEQTLKVNSGANGKLVVVDGIFSMDGDFADLPGIAALTRTYGAALMVDDAHAIGVVGRNGAGTPSHFGVDADVDIVMGTFSKSLAAIGGFIAASDNTIEYLKHTARTMIFSASLVPACVAAVSAALDICVNEPERRERLWRLVRLMITELKRLGFDLGKAETPIIPIYIKDDERAMTFWAALRDRGIFVNPVVPPAVPPGSALIRLSIMATHEERQLERAIETIESVGRELGVI